MIVLWLVRCVNFDFAAWCVAVAEVCDAHMGFSYVLGVVTCQNTSYLGRAQSVSRKAVPDVAPPKKIPFSTYSLPV